MSSRTFYNHVCGYYKKLPLRSNDELSPVQPVVVTYTESALHFTKLDFSRPVTQLLFCLTVFDGMSWILSSSGVNIASGNLVSSIPDRLESVTTVLSLLSRLYLYQICEGNADGKFGELLSKARFLKSSGMLLKNSSNI